MHLSAPTVSPQSCSFNHIVALKVEPPFRVSWKVRNGVRVRAGQLLAVVHAVRAPSGDAKADPVAVNGSTTLCESVPTCHRILAHCAGRVRDRRFTQNEEVTELDASENARWLSGADGSGSFAQGTVTSTVVASEQQNVSLQPTFFCRVGDEPCGHAVIVEGLCADCGDSVSLSTLENDTVEHRTPVWSSELSTVNATQASEDLSAARRGQTSGSLIYTQKLGFLTPGTNISVSSETAKSLEREKVLSLLRAKKLPLILDLDNTLLHAYPLPPPPDVTELLKDDPCQIVSLGHPALYVGGDAGSELFSGEAEVKKPPDNKGNPTFVETLVSSELQVDANDEKAEQGAAVGCGEELPREPNHPPPNGTFPGDVSDEMPQGSVRTAQYLPHYAEDFWSEAVQKVIRRWESWVISVEAFEYSSPCTTRGGLPSSSSCSSVSFPPFYLKPYTCYYKLRPGVLQFLRLASEKFELYLFTAGTAIHASSSLRVLDPERKWFGSRVFTREDLPQLDNGMLGLKTIQRIFPGETTTQNLVTVIDDCEAVWLPNSNVFKVHAYHWWPDPSLHPFLLLYCRRTSNGAGSHSEVPVKYIDPASFSRIRAASFSILNFCPSIIELCQSPRKDTFRAYETGTRVLFPPSCLDGGHSSALLDTQEDHAFSPDVTDPSVMLAPTANPQTEASPIPKVILPSTHGKTKLFEPCPGRPLAREHSSTAVSEHPSTAPKNESQVNGCTNGCLDLDTIAETAHDGLMHSDEVEGQQSPCKRRCLTQKSRECLHPEMETEANDSVVAPTDGCGSDNVYTLCGSDADSSPKRKRHNHSANLVIAFTETGSEPGSESEHVSAPGTKPTSFPKTADRDNESLEKAELSNGTEPLKLDASLTKQNPWLEKNFDRRRKGETWDELNARVLQTTTESWTAPKILRDSDRQLPCLWQILNRMHTQFFEEAEDALHGTDPTDLPSVKNILDAMRQEVLRNVVIKTTGIREAAIPHFEETDLGRASIALGARLVGRKSGDSGSHSAATHLLVGKETEYYMEAKKKGSFPYVAHLMWLEAALFTFTRFDESLFPVDLCEKQYRVFWDALENQESLVFTNDASAWAPCRAVYDDDMKKCATQTKARTSTASRSPLTNQKSVESAASSLESAPGSAGQESVIDFLENEPSKLSCTAVELNALEDELLTAFL